MRCGDTDPDDFDSILLEGPEGVVIASDWAGGFMDAVALRPKAWEPLIESDGAGILMAPYSCSTATWRLMTQPMRMN